MIKTKEILVIYMNTKLRKKNKQITKNKVAKKKGCGYTFALEIFSGDCIHMLVQKVILPIMSERKKNARRKLEMRANDHSPAHAQSFCKITLQSKNQADHG